MASKSQLELRKAIARESLGQIHEDSEVARHLAEWAIGEIESASNRGYEAGHKAGVASTESRIC